jgi:tetratricopeptide (TPR) repeat protein
MWGRDKPMSEFDRQVERNLRGIELEKSGRVDEAILMYEANLRDNFEGNHPYDRLATIYRKRNEIDEEIRVLEKAIWVFQNVVDKWRGDRPPKLAKFSKRLAKAKALKASAQPSG